MIVLFPRKYKFKKQHRRRSKQSQYEVNYIAPLLGFAGIKVQNSFRLTSVQIEASRKVITRQIRKKFKSRLRFCIFADLGITKKSSGVRMGKGKGNIHSWCTPVKAGRILFEINKNFIPINTIFKAFSLVEKKIPGKLKIVY